MKHTNEINAVKDCNMHSVYQTQIKLNLSKTLFHNSSAYELNCFYL